MKRYPFRIYDKRDGGPDEALQFKTSREILGLAWNVGRERAIEHCSLNHADVLRRLLRDAKRAGESVIAAFLCNYAVVIMVRDNETD